MMLLLLPALLPAVTLILRRGLQVAVRRNRPADSRFGGLMPTEVMVAVSPGLMVLGFTEQLIVGGSNAFTVIPAVHVAVSHGFKPSLPGLPSFTVAFTVYSPGASDAVSTLAVASLPVTPAPDQL